MKKHLRACHRVSRLFQPMNIVPAGAQVKNNDLTSKSQKLMIDEGIIASSQNGFFYNLPLATRALEKLTKLIDRNMAEIGAQKILCPTLISSNVWEKSGRLSLAGTEVFRLEDRHNKDLLLSPTHEESVTQLLAASPQMSYKQLPLLLYQITSKFRDEARPRFGLIRAREFLMKDLYSFDTSSESAQETYNLVSQAYKQIFQTIGVNFVKVKGVPGLMGGEVSHEFHYPADIGDDTLRLCEGCGSGWNQEAQEGTKCLNCGSEAVVEKKGIEVGHMFQLDTRYSAPLQALYTGAKGRLPLVMGSYGLGVSRILAASLEVLSLSDQLRWPAVLAPFSLVIVTPKEGSKESKLTDHIPEELYWQLQEVPQLEDNVIIDDRSHMTIGRRVLEAKRKGYPHIAVVGRAAAEQTPRIELIHVHSGETSLHNVADLVNVLVDSDQQLRLTVMQ